MEALIFLCCFFFDGSAAELSSPNYHVRDTASQRLERNLPFSVFSIIGQYHNEDAEAAWRANSIYSKFLKPLDNELIDRARIVTALLQEKDPTEEQIRQINGKGSCVLLDVIRHMAGPDKKVRKQDLLSMENDTTWYYIEYLMVDYQINHVGRFALTKSMREAFKNIKVTGSGYGDNNEESKDGCK